MGHGAEYRPLQGSEIRLLKVAPGAWDDRLSCTVHHVPLDERPEYVALSYAWGDAHDQVEVLVDGRARLVTRSLSAALRRFRWQCARGRAYDGFRFSGVVYIWADALCINQADVPEKEREIPRMRQVYTLCSRVCAWLGEDDGSTWNGSGDKAGAKDVLDEMERWLELMSLPDQADGPGQARFMPLDDTRTLVLQQEVVDHFGPRVDTFLSLWYGIGGLDWFRRLWVIQEAALPAAEPILMAGSRLFGFDRFIRWWVVIVSMRQQRRLSSGTDFEIFYRHGSLERSRARVQQQQQQQQQQGDSAVGNSEGGRGGPRGRYDRFGREFTEMMARRAPSTFVASNPHDYMYSTIGLCGGAEFLPPRLAPDYQKPFPLVCEDYARCAIEATGNVAILNRDDNRLWADYNEVLTDKLPSWVPDLRMAQFTFSVEGEVEASNVSFVGPDERFLKVRGFDLGEVVGVYLPMQDPEAAEWSSLSLSERLSRVHRFLEHVAREANIDLESTVLNFLQRRFLLLSNRQITASGTLPAPGDLQAVYYHYLQQGTDGNSTSCSPAGGPQDSSAAKVFVELADSLMLRRAYIVARGGMYGELIGPYYRGYCEGDRIAVLSGCRHPFIITPVAESEGPGYTLKGSCFAYDGASTTKLYTADDFSLELHQERTFEDFILV